MRVETEQSDVKLAMERESERADCLFIQLIFKRLVKAYYKFKHELSRRCTICEVISRVAASAWDLFHFFSLPSQILTQRRYARRPLLGPFGVQHAHARRTLLDSTGVAVVVCIHRSTRTRVQLVESYSRLAAASRLTVKDLTAFTGCSRLSTASRLHHFQAHFHSRRTSLARWWLRREIFNELVSTWNMDSHYYIISQIDGFGEVGMRD